MQKRSFIAFLSLCLLSCNSNTHNRQSSKNYFSIADYFNSEINRLTASDQMVDKVVSINGLKERKQLRGVNWKQEFKIFSENDINKSSWKGEFTTTKVNDTSIYTTINPKIPIKRLKVVQSGSTVKFIEIVTSVENYLYTSNDTLLYIPDQTYRISNRQDIRLLKPRTYQIVGKFRN